MSGTERPPEPDGVTLLGNGLAFSRDPFGALREWARGSGIVRLSFPGRPLYLVTGPELVEQALVEDQDAFTIGQPRRETFDGVENEPAGPRRTRRRFRLHLGL